MSRLPWKAIRSMALNGSKLTIVGWRCLICDGTDIEPGTHDEVGCAALWNLGMRDTTPADYDELQGPEPR